MIDWTGDTDMKKKKKKKNYITFVLSFFKIVMDDLN